jgi:phosphate uptake regulator
MSVEVRKVQRLGTSSLVVTLPKDWTRRFDLKPGDKIYLIDEGGSLRLVPAREQESVIPVVDATKIFDPSLVSTILHCLYVSNVDEAEIKVRDASSVILEVKKKASDFIGLEVYEEGNDLIKVKVLMDTEKIDLSSLIRLLGHNTLKSIELLERILRGEMRGAEDEIQILKKDFVRYQHAIIRYLMLRGPLGDNGIERHQVALITSYLGYVNDVIIDIIERFIEGSKIPSYNLSDVLGMLKDVIVNVMLNVISPSMKRLGPLCAQIEGLRLVIDERLRSSSEKKIVEMLARLHDVIRVLNIITCVLLCKTIVSKATWVKRGERGETSS